MFVYARRNRWFILLVSFAWLDAVRGDILDYKSGRKELILRCPGWEVDGDVLFLGLWRKYDNVLLANWTTSDRGLVTYDRVTLGSARPRSPHVLEVVLRYVTCYDVATYMCNMIVRSRGRSLVQNESQAFTHGGGVTDPVLRAEPNQARYRVGDSLALNCSARTGNANNTIVWETRLPGGTFSNVTAGECDLHTNITEHKPTRSDSESCGVTGVSSLTRILRSDDDTREWRCKLASTGHSAVFATAVQCPDGTGCSQPCRPLAEQSTSEVATQQVSHHPRAESVRESVQPDTSVESHHLLVLIAIICALFVTMVISFIIITVMLKKHTKQRLAPLILTPPPSESSCVYTPISRVRPRSLPQLPDVMDHYNASQDALCLHGRRRQGTGGTGEMDTRPKMYSPDSASVYVSMSAMPSLHEDPKADHSPPCTEPASEGRPPQFRRSESIYSNDREACDTHTTKISNGSVDSRDGSHVTMGNLKGWM